MHNTLSKYAGGLLFWLLPFSILFAGSTQSDSFLSKNDSTLSPSLQAQLNGKSIDNQLLILLDTIEKIQFNNSGLAMECAEEAFRLSKKTGDEFLEAQSRFWSADLNFNQSIYTGNLEILYSYVEIAANIFQKKDNADLWLIRSWSLMAEIKYSISILNGENNKGFQKFIKAPKTKAKKHLNKAFDLYYAKQLQQKKPALEGHLLAKKGAIFYKPYQDSAMINWLLAEEIFKKEKDTLGLARVNLNIALSIKDKRAEPYYKKAIQLYQKIQNPNAIKRAYLRYGTFCILQYQKAKKIDWWKKGIENLKKGRNLMGDDNICDALNRLGQAYSRKKEFEKSHYYFGEAIFRAKAENNTYCLWKYLEDMQYTCNNVVKCDSLATELSNAYSKILSDREGVVTKAVTEKETYQQEVKEKEALRKRKQLIWLGVGILGLISLIFYLITQRLRIQKLKSQAETQEAQLKEKDAKIQALGARMNPHFISNTLNAIDSMIYTNDKMEASKYLVKFAKLSRLVLANSESTLIPLEKEIEMLEYYLSLEKMRFEDEIDFDFGVDENLDTSNIYIPPMLLQPFIENAIIHGIQPKDDGGKIVIQIGSNNKNQLECIIEDNGIGRAQAKVIQQNSSVNRKSFSTKISEDRINLINNLEGANLITEDLYNPVGESNGTKIIITLPKNQIPHEQN